MSWGYARGWIGYGEGGVCVPSEWTSRETISETLEELREQIDAIDERLIALVNERAECALKIGRVKQAAREAAPFYQPAREAQVLRRVIARNGGPIADEAMARLFREVMSVCLALERVMRIAYLGPAGTFTQAAALKHFGHSVQTVPLSAIDEVFREVEAGSCDYGLVPVENSTEGVVNHTLDMFVSSPLKICGEVALRIHQNLAGNVQALEDVRAVYSHQQSLAQCREWLDANLPEVARHPVPSNAEAARRAATEPGAVAICGGTAAELYGLRLLEVNIEDEPDNTTRFLIVGQQSTPASGDDKTSLLVSARNRPGALHDLLSPLARHGVDMTRIESRPSRRGLWEYVFFVDFNGHADDPRVARALNELAQEAALFKVLGSYPRAVL